MLSDNDARSAAYQFPGARAVRVIDARSNLNEPPAFEVFSRPWLEHGVRVRDGSQKGPGPVVFLLTYPVNESAAAEHAQLVHRFADGREYKVLKAKPDGRLFRADGNPAAERFRHLDPLTLVMSGRNSTSRPVTEFPVSIKIDAPPNHQGVYLHIEAFPVDSGIIAPPTGCWFRLTNVSGATSVRVDVELGWEEDEWRVEAAGKITGRRVAEPPPRPQPKILVVVFDRTCPDRNRWTDARELVKEGVDRRKQSNVSISNTPPPDYGLPQETPVMRSETVFRSSPQPPPVAPGDFNSDIRRGLAHGLRQAGNNCPSEVEVIWFADEVTDGLVTPPDVRELLAAGKCGRLDTIRIGKSLQGDELESTLSGLSYIPGLDLWDALDAGLYEAHEVLRHRLPAAVLIIGNSPPHPPSAIRDSPFRPILNRVGMRSATRRTSFSAWANGAPQEVNFNIALERLARTGVPLVYLFLAGHEPVNTRFFQNFTTIQNEVRQALERFFPVITASPTTEGVALGIQDALGLLRKPVGLAYVHPAESL